jgi:hypothetical protein
LFRNLTFLGAIHCKNNFEQGGFLMSEPLEVVVGQPLQITLQSMMGSTGYGWYLSKLDGGIMLSSATIQPIGPGIVPVLHIFDFIGAEAGTFNLEFKLAAAWRPGEPGDTKSYEVTVKNPEKTAAEDIETAMKGRSFVDSSVLNGDSAMIVKYAAPITSIKYAAPMSQCDPSNAGFSVYPSVVYAAPLSQATAANMSFSANPAVVYAAPMSQAAPSNIAFGANPTVVYAAPMSQAAPSNMAYGAYPYVVYAAPMSQAASSAVANGAYPNVIYAAPMIQNALPAMIQPYAAPMFQVLYAAPFRTGCC